MGKSIYEELHPETRHGVARAIGKHDAVAKSATAEIATERFTTNASAATGRAERTIQIDVERAPVLLRADIEASVERLLAMLDALDGDYDLEPTGDDEPSLWFASLNTYHDPNASTDDREDDHGDSGEMDDDREPALGWTDAVLQAPGGASMGSLGYADEEEINGPCVS